MAASDRKENGSVITSDRTIRLVMTGRVWNEVIRQLSHGTAVAAFALLRQHGTPVAIEFLCDSIHLTEKLPTGDQLKPLDDWLVITLNRTGQPSPLDISQFAVHNWQTMIWLNLDQNNPALWSVSILRHGKWVALTDTHIIGSGMLRLSPSSVSPDRSVNAYSTERWSRTRGVLGDDVFDRLQNSTVTVVGAGRNGSQLAFQLAAVGVGTLRLFDADILHLHNMDANPGIPAAACGIAKVKALAAALKMFRPDLTVQIIQQRASYRTLEDYLRERSDLVVTCTDSDTPRLGTALVARRNLFVHLDVATSIQRTEAGTLSMTGDATLLLPTEGCCSCVGGFRDPVATRHDLTAPPNSLRRQMQPAWNVQRAGSLVTLNSMVVGAAVQSWLDLLTGDLTTSIWHRIAWTPGQGLRCDSAAVSAADNCEICHMFRSKTSKTKG